MYGDYNWDIKIRGEVGKITRNVSNRTRRSIFRFDRVKNSTKLQTDTQTGEQSDYLGFLSKQKKSVLTENLLLLHFMSDRPRCVPGQKMRYEAHKFRSVAVECRVAANPVTGLRFSWSFNGTAPKYAQKVSVPIRCIFAERS